MSAPLRTFNLNEIECNPYVPDMLRVQEVVLYCNTHFHATLITISKCDDAQMRKWMNHYLHMEQVGCVITLTLLEMNAEQI